MEINIENATNSKEFELAFKQLIGKGFKPKLIIMKRGNDVRYLDECGQMDENSMIDYYFSNEFEAL